MAKYGASYLYFAPFAETDPDTNAAKLPKYGTKVHLGSLITVADTVNVQSAEISGDNAVEDRVDEVADYDVSTSVTELENTVAAAVFGSNLSSDGDLSYSFDDESPQGGLGLLSKRKYKGKVFYKGIFYGKRCGFSKRYFLVLVACRHLTCTKTECRKMFLSLIAPLTTIRLNRGKRSNRLPYIFAQGQER